MYNVWHLDTVSSYDRHDRMVRSEQRRLVRCLRANRRTSLMAVLADWWRKVLHIKVQVEAGPRAATFSTLEFSR